MLKFQNRIDTNSNVEISKLESQPFEAQSIWESWSIVYWITDRIRIQDSEPALELMFSGNNFNYKIPFSLVEIENKVGIIWFLIFFVNSKTI